MSIPVFQAEFRAHSKAMEKFQKFAIGEAEFSRTQVQALFKIFLIVSDFCQCSASSHVSDEIIDMANVQLVTRLCTVEMGMQTYYLHRLHVVGYRCTKRSKARPGC